MYQRARLKEEVKISMRNTRPRPMWIALLFLLITGLGSYIIQWIGGALSGSNLISAELSLLVAHGYDVEEAIQEILWTYGNQLPALIGSVVGGGVLVSILGYLWNALMNVGFQGYCLSMIHNEQPGVKRLFCGFPLVGKVLLTNVLVWVFTVLWSMLYAVIFAVVAVVASLMMESVPAVAVILLVLAFIGFMILIIRLSLRYCMTNFVLLDTGAYGLDAITESKRLTKKNKGRIFMMGLSFIGWYLLMYGVLLAGVLAVSIVTGVIAGVGNSLGATAAAIYTGIILLVIVMIVIALISMWLQPYVMGAQAKLYEFLRGPAQPEQGNTWPQIYDGNGSDPSGQE